MICVICGETTKYINICKECLEDNNKEVKMVELLKKDKEEDNRDK